MSSLILIKISLLRWNGNFAEIWFSNIKRYPSAKIALIFHPFDKIFNFTHAYPPCRLNLLSAPDILFQLLIKKDQIVTSCAHYVTYHARNCSLKCALIWNRFDRDSVCRHEFLSGEINEERTNNAVLYAIGDSRLKRGCTPYNRVVGVI